MNAKRRKMQKSEQTVPRLPVEVWGDILQLLDFNSVYNFSSCCRYFRDSTTGTLQNVNLFRQKVSEEILGLLKDACDHILVLNLSHASSLKTEDLLKCLSNLRNIVTLDVSRTGLTIPSFVSISQHLRKLVNLSMDLLCSEENWQLNIMENALLNQYKAAFSKLKFIHFHAQDGILFNAFWDQSLWILEDAEELFELRLTLYHDHEHEFIKMIPEKSKSALKLPFRKLTISTVTLFQNSSYFHYNVQRQYSGGSNFFDEFIKNNWQFVLFRASEDTFEKVIMSQTLFDNLQVHCKDIANKVTINYNSSKLFKKPSILHLWHPSLFKSYHYLGKAIFVEIEREIHKAAHGNNASVMGLHLSNHEDEWKKTEKNILASGTAIYTNLTVTVENIRLNAHINILENITTYIFRDINLVSDDFFYHLFHQSPYLEILILRGTKNRRNLAIASENIKYAQNLKTILLSGDQIDFKQWLSALIKCEKIESIAFGCALLTDALQIGKADCLKFIKDFKNLERLLVCFKYHFPRQETEVSVEQIKVLKECFQCKIEKCKQKSLYFDIIEFKSYVDLDAQREVFYPIYTKFLKPLQNLKLKYEHEIKEAGDCERI